MRLFLLAFAYSAVLLLGAVRAEEENVQEEEDAEQYTGSQWGICWGDVYGDGFCDCNCSPGVRDIDCAVSGSNPPHQAFQFSAYCPEPVGNRNIWCNNIGVCEPCDGCGVWTCNPSKYDANDGCHCNCGMPDPDCNVDQFNALGCYPGLQGVGREICDATGTCSLCGNGAIDSGETCDRRGGCCSSDCSTMFQDNIDCQGGSGYCSSGVCKIPSEIDDIHVAKDEQGNPIRTSTSIKVEWVLENESNPQVDTFCIEKNEKVNGQWTGWVVSNPGVNGTKRTKTVNNLNPDTTYKFRIRSDLGPIPKSSSWESTFGISTLP